MHNGNFHFITFILFSCMLSGFMLSGFGLERFIPKPNPIRISGIRTL